ncbi:uncharacterized protein LOC135384319 [Ornithodoros turicata]|uniref:uncharacterized protein LOC135384319 n=1 Tax=Ornithodoros turicata TaxID=34597 RepID=UPI00313A0A1B
MNKVMAGGCCVAESAGRELADDGMATAASTMIAWPVLSDTGEHIMNDGEYLYMTSTGDRIYMPSAVVTIHQQQDSHEVRTSLSPAPPLTVDEGEASQIKGATPQLQRETMKDGTEEKLWSASRTRFFINCFKEHRLQIGKKGGYRTKKMLWATMADRLNEEFKENFTATQVENRWKSLERAYKNAKKKNNTSGSGTVVFEYEEELHDILESQHHISPVVLMAPGKTVIKRGSTKIAKATSHSTTQSPPPQLPLPEEEGEEETSETPVTRHRRRRAPRESATEVLRELVNQLKTIEEARQKRHEEKIALLERFVAASVCTECSSKRTTL